jgi:hypothetical protein
MLLKIGLIVHRMDWNALNWAPLLTFCVFGAIPPDWREQFPILSMTHSDQFVPQGINAARQLRFIGPDSGSSFRRIGHCAQCNTTSSRYFNVVDFDGSLSGTGRPSIIGSQMSWWNFTSECHFNKTLMNLWVCPKSKVGIIFYSFFFSFLFLFLLLLDLGFRI